MDGRMDEGWMCMEAKKRSRRMGMIEKIHNTHTNVRRSIMWLLMKELLCFIKWKRKGKAIAEHSNFFTTPTTLASRSISLNKRVIHSIQSLLFRPFYRIVFLLLLLTLFLASIRGIASLFSISSIYFFATTPVTTKSLQHDETTAASYNLSLICINQKTTNPTATTTTVMVEIA